jgi:hypothetical protein
MLPHGNGEESMTLNVYLHRAYGMWGWKKDYITPPSISIDDVEVTIIQNGIRILNLQTKSDKSYEALLLIALNIIKLFQISEGYFHVIDCVEYITTGNESTCKDMNELKKDGLIDFYRTHRNFISRKFELLPPSDIITVDNYKNFVELYGNLFVQHNAFLYYCVDNGLSMDLRMANLIELCEPIADYDPNYTLPFKYTLKYCIKKLVDNYGQLIFKKEIDANIFDFEDENKNGNSSILKKLVNTRVNLLHYKLKPKECFNKGPEMIIYCSKIHLLYRYTMLRLLGIDVCVTNVAVATEYIETGWIRDFNFNAFVANY